MTSRKLLEIGDDLQALADLLDEAGPELEPDIATAFDALFRSVADEEAIKLDQCVNLIRRKQAEARAARDEADVYLHHARVRERAVERIELFLFQYLMRTGRTKVATATNRVLSIQKNGGYAPMRFLDPALDPASLPDEFVKKSINTEAVRRGLAERNPAALAIAVLEERGSHLRIR